MLKILLTVLCVSVDGFFTGVAIGLKKALIKLSKLIIIGIIPIIMAFPVMLIGRDLSLYINNNTIKIIGFTLFFLMAINSFRQIKKNSVIEDLSIKGSILIGFTIGLDSSVCAFSLALENYNPFITPFYFGISHLILIWLGNYLFNKIDITKIKYLKYISPILFLIIAISKLY